MKICCEPIELTCSERKPHSSYVVWGIAAYRAHASTYVHLWTLLPARVGLWVPPSAEARERPATNRAENRAVSASVDLNDYGKGRASEEYNSIAKLEGREI
jgi:hypothetical protein